MLEAADTWRCHDRGIPSDQGYHNFLILSGAHARDGLNVISWGRGAPGAPVHTIGALNGNDVPMDQLGPLDSKWKVRDPVKGYVTDVAGAVSPVVHQWDRWSGEMAPWIDRAFAKDNFVPGDGRDLYPKPFEFVAYDPETCTDRPFVTKHKKGCDRLRAENHHWVSQDRVKASDACCKFGGGVKT